MTGVQWDIEVPTLKLTDSTSSPSAARPGHLLPLPTQTRGGDVRDAPFAPLPAIDHLANWHSAIPSLYEAPLDGDAA